jgi:hypothetical protein
MRELSLLCEVELIAGSAMLLGNNGTPVWPSKVAELMALPQL